VSGPPTPGIVELFTERVSTHGPSARGADWNSEESQVLRFEQLMKVRDGTEPYSLLDYGCGYGALARFLQRRGDRVTYQGFDVTPAMVEQGREFLAGLGHASITGKRDELRAADYAVASGVFNLKLEVGEQEWQRYVLDVLHDIAGLARRGFAFNVLTSYSDPPLMRADLYYADPCFYFDYCKRNFSRHVALLHDYGLWEFTLIVRHDAGAAISATPS
jgi:SAM-dependent methyltransferase